MSNFLDGFAVYHVSPYIVSRLPNKTIPALILMTRNDQRVGNIQSTLSRGGVPRRRATKNANLPSSLLPRDRREASGGERKRVVKSGKEKCGGAGFGRFKK